MIGFNNKYDSIGNRIFTVTTDSEIILDVYTNSLHEAVLVRFMGNEFDRENEASKDIHVCVNGYVRSLHDLCLYITHNMDDILGIVHNKKDKKMAKAMKA